jgi:hypothetical protein
MYNSSQSINQTNHHQSKSTTMIITRSITRSGRTNTAAAAAAAAAAAITPPPQAGIAIASSSATKMNKVDRRISEALSELLSLGVSETTIIKTGVKRQRVQAQHPDAAFYKSYTFQSRDAGKNGGLVAGSKHHYLRGV